MYSTDHRKSPVVSCTAIRLPHLIVIIVPNVIALSSWLKQVYNGYIPIGCLVFLGQMWFLNWPIVWGTCENKFVGMDTHAFLLHTLHQRLLLQAEIAGSSVVECWARVYNPWEPGIKSRSWWTSAVSVNASLWSGPMVLTRSAHGAPC